MTNDTRLYQWTDVQTSAESQDPVNSVLTLVHVEPCGSLYSQRRLSTSRVAASNLARRTKTHNWTNKPADEAKSLFADDDRCREVSSALLCY